MLPPPFVSNTCTDRETLELAAFAAGYVINAERQADRDKNVERKTAKNKVSIKAASLWIIGISPWWSPLLDDRQAFRLAVDLGLHVRVLKTFTAVYHDTDIGTVLENHDDDKYAATRRAITRAAALIGMRLIKNAANSNVETFKSEQSNYTDICEKINDGLSLEEFATPQHADERDSNPQPGSLKVELINNEARPAAWLFTYKCPGKLVEFVDLEPELHPIKRDDLIQQGCTALSVIPLYTATQLGVSLK